MHKRRIRTGGKGENGDGGWNSEVGSQVSGAEVGMKNANCKMKNANWLVVRIQCAVRYATNQILTNSATVRLRAAALDLFDLILEAR
jgi:hypothetical protein